MCTGFTARLGSAILSHTIAIPVAIIILVIVAGPA